MMTLTNTGVTDVAAILNFPISGFCCFYANLGFGWVVLAVIQMVYSVQSRARFVRNHARIFKITHSEKSSVFFFTHLFFQITHCLKSSAF